MGTVSQILDVEGHLFARDSFRLNAVPDTEAQIIVETASIRVHRVWGELQVILPLEPISRQFVLPYQRVLFPANLGHVSLSWREGGRSYPYSMLSRQESHQR